MSRRLWTISLPWTRRLRARNYGQLANLMARMDRVLNLPPGPPPSTIAPSTPSTTLTVTINRPRSPDSSSDVRGSASACCRRRSELN
ncbi:hypothetical protein B0H16DRAFT_1581977 [Mycena metata]|uniref:Uncharacterized protein n=1 Tax=Mycena metata TaxID=1033252 RepID=A0AAD7I082_9AGAR|nr:hypothetical protein B0H16DRAFT_1581977 [Mycena metata]